MTDQDELRDRIAEVIDARMAEWLGIKTELNINEYAAQAIIDEFGLQVEECPCVFDCKETRVVGKWEQR